MLYMHRRMIKVLAQIEKTAQVFLKQYNMYLLGAIGVQDSTVYSTIVLSYYVFGVFRVMAFVFF